MAVNKYLELDGISYPVKIVKLNRTADTLDLYAYRTEDGVLHRKCIGTYFNYTVEVGIEDDLDLYDALFDKLSSPVNSMKVKFPNEDVAQDRYISSLKDAVSRVMENGTLYKSMSFKTTCVAPTRKG